MAMKMLALIAAAIGGTAWGDRQAVFHTSADAVTIDVSVSDNRRPVRGLTAADFEVLDSGVSQEIIGLSFDNLPLDITFLMDVSHSMTNAPTAHLGWPGFQPAPDLSAVSRGLTSVLRSLRTTDRIQLIGFAATARQLALSNPVPLDVPAVDRYLGRTAFLDALTMSLIPPTEPGRRRLIVAVTDAKDNASFIDGRTRLRVIDRSDAVIHVIAFGRRDASASIGRPMMDVAWQHHPGGGFDEFLTDLVERTGGRFMPLMPGEEFASMLATAIDEFRTRYVLQYIPRAVAETGWHPVEVKLKRKGNYEIRSRRGYDRGK
jgi:hypothetical protein